MGTPTLSAQDLLPLARKLAPEEQVRLAKLLLRAAVTDSATAYAAEPARDDEFRSDDDALSWEGEGWDEFYAPG